MTQKPQQDQSGSFNTKTARIITSLIIVPTVLLAAFGSPLQAAVPLGG